MASATESVAIQADLSCVGYFDDPTSREPTHWPATDAGCPICGEPLGDRLPDGWRCRSIMPASGRRSYFIAYHSSHSSEEMDQREDDYVDAIFAWDDSLGAAQ